MNRTRIRRLRPWLGTYVAIEAVAGSDEQACVAVEAAYADVAHIHAAMSFQSATSDLAQLHRHAVEAPVRVGWHTWTVLAEAVALAHDTDGVFDPTVASRLVDHGALPMPAAPRPDPAGSWRDIELLDDLQVRFKRQVWVDLGGIAKGYAVDRAIETLQAHGVDHAVVNAGGDLRVFGDDDPGMRLAVRSPDNPAVSIPLGTLRNRAVATSGEFFLGRADAPSVASPIIDPHGGFASRRRRSVTVIAGRCAIADALTKVVSLLGHAAQPLLDRFGATAAIIEPPDRILAASDFWRTLGHAPSFGEQLAFA